MQETVTVMEYVYRIARPLYLLHPVFIPCIYSLLIYEHRKTFSRCSRKISPKYEEMGTGKRAVQENHISETAETEKKREWFIVSSRHQSQIKRNSPIADQSTHPENVLYRFPVVPSGGSDLRNAPWYPPRQATPVQTLCAQ